MKGGRDVEGEKEREREGEREGRREKRRGGGGGRREEKEREAGERERGRRKRGKEVRERGRGRGGGGGQMKGTVGEIHLIKKALFVLQTGSGSSCKCKQTVCAHIHLDFISRDSEIYGYMCDDKDGKCSPSSPPPPPPPPSLPPLDKECKSLCCLEFLSPLPGDVSQSSDGWWSKSQRESAMWGGRGSGGLGGEDTGDHSQRQER